MRGGLHTGNFEVGVHIADVSYFVEEGSVLDATAGQRATSVYLVQKVGALLRDALVLPCGDVWDSAPTSLSPLQVVPMLPRLLCEELCSLNPLADRLTFSVVWTITPEGKVEPFQDPRWLLLPFLPSIAHHLSFHFRF